MVLESPWCPFQSRLHARRNLHNLGFLHSLQLLSTESGCGISKPYQSPPEFLQAIISAKALVLALALDRTGSPPRAGTRNEDPWLISMTQSPAKKKINTLFTIRTLRCAKGHKM